MSSNVEIEEPYVQAEQQRDASLMGMYLFLAAEIMLFGAGVHPVSPDRSASLN